MISPDIYTYIKQQENTFETEEIQVGENWFWNFRKHVQLIFHLKNGVFYTGENNWLRAFKNIMEPILNLSYWTEDIEVKDVVFFIEQDNGKALSFLVKKYHDEVYTREHDLETLFDEITESDLDYGGVLVQEGAEVPEVLPLNSIAFCDQTDLMGGPVFFKHYFSPDKLRAMSKFGWGEEKNGATVSLEELCTLATFEKDPIGTLNEKQNRVPGKSIEVYIGRGALPVDFLEDNGDMDKYVNQIQIVAFYTDKDSKKQGVTLYRKKEQEGALKFFTSKKVYQRALGRGVGESLLHPQIWTNFLTIHKTNMLEAASKIPLQTTDPNYTTRNKIQDMENLEVTVVQEGSTISQIPTAAPANIQLYANEINSWYDQAQLSGAAFDPIMGKEATSGTTFRGQERTVAQGRGLHDRRRGQRAKFIEEIYRDWIIPDIIREIVKGKEFMATLSTEELMWVSDEMANKAVEERTKEALLNGVPVTREQQETLRQIYKQEFLKKGNKQLIKILKDEFADIEIKMGINIAGKQKDLATLSDKLLSVFQFIFANPAGFQQAMQIPALAKSFENILEFGGMSIGDFSSLLQGGASTAPQQQVEAPPLTMNQPVQ
jgi:hypothetical protein